MLSYIDTPTLRQVRCARRAARARGCAWVLMPVTAAVFSVALWSDPVAQPQLQSRLDGVKPMLAAVGRGELPKDEVRAITDATLQTASDINARLAGLPATRSLTNRPAAEN